MYDEKYKNVNEKYMCKNKDVLILSVYIFHDFIFKSFACFPVFGIVFKIVTLFLAFISCTLHGYYDIWRERFADYSIASFCKNISYQHWRASWYAYLSLLDIDYEQWNMCDNCGSSPDIIICDGTRLGFWKLLLLMKADDQENDGKIVKRA